MADPLILTFDIGTQSTRAVLVNPRGEILFKSQKTYEQPYFSRQPGWAEQKAQVYWDCICETSRTLKAKSGGSWNDIIAVTCSTFRDSCLCLDRNNVPLRDVILWLDDRRAEHLPLLPASARLLLKLAGLSEGVDLQRRTSACNWIIQNEEELWEETSRFVFISAWLNYKFSGNLADSTASMIGHIPFDCKTRRWMRPGDFRQLIWLMGKDKFCALAEPGEELGTITPAAAEETGLPAGLPLIATGSDKGCETLGLSCLSADKAALSFGTTATVQFSTTHYFEPQPHMPAYPAVTPGYYNPELEIYRGYWLLSWFKREFAAKEVAQAQEQGISAERLLDERLKEMQPGCDGLIMQPYFTPGLNMPHAKGAIIGFSDVHTRIHLYRAIIEGINFALMEGLRNMEKRGGMQIKQIFVAGGGSQSDEICRITASQFGLPVYRTQTHEVTAVGSSLVGFIAKGIFSSHEEGLAEMVHIKDEFLPKPGDHRIYEALYGQIFTKIFNKLSPFYGEIGNIIQ
jgi:sugar (pentulose or hexulose) kinase